MRLAARIRADTARFGVGTAWSLRLCAIRPGDGFSSYRLECAGAVRTAYSSVNFAKERDLNVVVLLDTSGSMNYPPSASEHNKLEFAKGIALALAYIALADGSMYGLSIWHVFAAKKG